MKKTLLLFVLLFTAVDNGFSKPSLLERISKSKKPSFSESWTIPKVGMELVPIPSGEFFLGSESGKADEKPQHKVTLTKPFWVGKYEVQRKEYFRVIAPKTKVYKNDPYPVTPISWIKAAEFCKTLTEREQVKERIPEGYVYRLPTEAEWEYCCRAQSVTKFSFGNSEELLYKYANYCDKSNTNRLTWQDLNHDDGHDKLAPVGSYLPNRWGIHDMHGNAWEWCYDIYGEYNSNSTINPTGSHTGFDRVIRGGSWYHAPLGVRSANRDDIDPFTSDFDFGFRVVLAPDYLDDTLPSEFQPELSEKE